MANSKQTVYMCQNQILSCYPCILLSAVAFNLDMSDICLFAQIRVKIRVSSVSIFHDSYCISAFRDRTDQDLTAQNVESDLCSTFSTLLNITNKRCLKFAIVWLIFLDYQYLVGLNAFADSSWRNVVTSIFSFFHDVYIFSCWLPSGKSVYLVSGKSWVLSPAATN